VIETLLERRLVKIAGRKEAPGRPMMYATTPEFLEVFSLKDLESLPDLKEFREIDGAVAQATTAAVESVETHPEDAPRETTLEVSQASEFEPSQEIKSE